MLCFSSFLLPKAASTCTLTSQSGYQLACILSAVRLKRPLPGKALRRQLSHAFCTASHAVLQRVGHAAASQGRDPNITSMQEGSSRTIGMVSSPLGRQLLPAARHRLQRGWTASLSGGLHLDRSSATAARPGHVQSTEWLCRPVCTQFTRATSPFLPIQR
jgi:hypothetical protein